jgi:hypothetical protein
MGAPLGNKYALGNNGGRPLKFATVEELIEKIDSYFTKTVIEEWTITGLALALGTDRQTLINYESKDDYFDTIKKAKTMVEHSYELSLRKNGRTGDIFALKNFNWKDKSESEVTGKDGEPLMSNITIEFISPNPNVTTD